MSILHHHPPGRLPLAGLLLLWLATSAAGAAEVYEEFRLTDGRVFIGVYDDARKAILVDEGGIRASIAAEEGDIAARKPAAAPKTAPALSEADKQERARRLREIGRAERIKVLERGIKDQGAEGERLAKEAVDLAARAEDKRSEVAGLDAANATERARIDQLIKDNAEDEKHGGWAIQGDQLIELNKKNGAARKAIAEAELAWKSAVERARSEAKERNRLDDRAKDAKRRSEALAASRAVLVAELAGLRPQ